MSDDGLNFRDIGSIAVGSRQGFVDGPTQARYVALITSWQDGDADLLALRVLVSQAPTWSDSTLPAPRYRVIAGALPDGLRLEETIGRISGTPTAAGAYRFTISVDNGVGDPVGQDFVGEVLAAHAVQPGGSGPSAPGVIEPGGPSRSQANSSSAIAATGLDLFTPLALAVILATAGMALVGVRRSVRTTSGSRSSTTE